MSTVFSPGEYCPYFQRAIFLTDSFLGALPLDHTEEGLFNDRTRKLAENMLTIISEGCPFLQSEVSLEAENHLVTPASDPFPKEYELAGGTIRGTLLGFKISPYCTHDGLSMSVGLCTITHAHISEVHGEDVPSLVVTPLDGYSAASFLTEQQLN